MRTTLTLDDDIAAELKQLARTRDVPFRRVVNEVLRSGLTSVKHPKPVRRYRCPTHAMGRPLMSDLTKALRLADELETEELTRKLEQRK